MKKQTKHKSKNTKNKSKNTKNKSKNQIKKIISKKIIGGSNLPLSNLTLSNLALSNLYIKFLSNLYTKYNKFNYQNNFYPNSNITVSNNQSLIMNNLKKCDECSDDLQILNYLNQGSSSILLSIKAKNDCKTDNLFLTKDEIYSIKICYETYVCEYKNEIINLIKISLLYANNICSNFLKVFGFNIQCKLFKEFLKSLTKIDCVNFKEYKLESYNDINTNIITNFIDGTTLDEYSKKLSKQYKFSLEQIFELIYSILCCIHYCKIYPNDNNFGNIMIDKNQTNTLIKINKTNFYLTNYNSIFKIDYQSVTNFDDIMYGAYIDLDVNIKSIINGYKAYIDNTIFSTIYANFFIDNLKNPNDNLKNPNDYIKKLSTLEIFDKLKIEDINTKYKTLEYIPDLDILKQLNIKYSDIP